MRLYNIRKVYVVVSFLSLIVSLFAQPGDETMVQTERDNISKLVDTNLTSGDFGITNSAVLIHPQLALVATNTIISLKNQKVTKNKIGLKDLQENYGKKTKVINDSFVNFDLVRLGKIELKIKPVARNRDSGYYLEPNTFYVVNLLTNKVRMLESKGAQDYRNNIKVLDEPHAVFIMRQDVPYLAGFMQSSYQYGTNLFGNIYEKFNDDFDSSLAKALLYTKKKKK